MANVFVSNSTQLKAAMQAAVNSAGTTIQLRTGDYNLNMKNFDFHGVTVKEAAGAVATISSVTFNNVRNLTFDGIDFRDLPGNDGKLFVAAFATNLTVQNSTFEGVTDSAGFGTGSGFWVNNSQGVTLQNSTIQDFGTGAWLGATSNLAVNGNHFSEIAWDGMQVGGVHNAMIAHNDISLNIPSGRAHSDGIQFYNEAPNNPASHVTIQDNTIHTNNGISHGIFMGNGLADDTGSVSTFYQDVTIKNNTVVSGQVSGIAVGQTNGLIIQDNIVLQDPDRYSTDDIRTPVIRVQKDSTGVNISDNYTHKAPVASGVDWYPVRGDAPPAWMISNNWLVPRGTTPGDISGIETEPVRGNGQADHWVFGNAISTDVASKVDFSEGDTIEFSGFKFGTFAQQNGGNPLEIALNGTGVTIDSFADLEELQRASTKVHIRDGGNDTLVMDIDLKVGIHTVQMTELAHDYYAYLEIA